MESIKALRQAADEIAERAMPCILVINWEDEEQ